MKLRAMLVDLQDLKCNKLIVTQKPQNISMNKVNLFESFCKKIPAKKVSKRSSITYLSKCSSDQVINQMNAPISNNKDITQDIKWHRRKLSSDGTGPKTLKPTSRPKSFERSVKKEKYSISYNWPCKFQKDYIEATKINSRFTGFRNSLQNRMKKKRMSIKPVQSVFTSINKEYTENRNKEDPPNFSIINFSCDSDSEFYKMHKCKGYQNERGVSQTFKGKGENRPKTSMGSNIVL